MGWVLQKLANERGGVWLAKGGMPVFLLSWVQSWCSYILIDSQTWNDGIFNLIMPLLFDHYRLKTK